MWFKLVSVFLHLSRMELEWDFEIIMFHLLILDQKWEGKHSIKSDPSNKC